MAATVTEMLRTTPKGAFVEGDTLAQCIEECFNCAQVCVSCADACLGEDNVEMLVRCIRLNLDCGDICESTGRQLSRQQQPDTEMLTRAVELCELAARRCAEECEHHASRHEHCRICGEACRACQQSCEQLLAALGQAAPAAQH